MRKLINSVYTTMYAILYQVCKNLLHTCIYIYHRQTHQSSSINQKAANKISEKPEEKIVLESNIAQSDSQIIEDEDDTAIFDAPQKNSISKPIESDNCLKVEKKSKPEDQNIKKAAESNNVEQNASQIIEEDNSPTMDLNECVGDVS